MKELKKTDEAKHKDICTKVREDAYVEAGENDNLLVQKVSRRPRHDRGPRLQLPRGKCRQGWLVQAGVTPTEETIANLTYPGSRKLYVYVKGEHMTAKPSMKNFIEAYSKAWGTAASSRSAGWCRSAAPTPRPRRRRRWR